MLLLLWVCGQRASVVQACPQDKRHIHSLAVERGGHFEIDPARVAADARFDGLSILRTNSKLDTLSVALAYRELWRVEQIFRTAKAILETRPIYHQRDAAIVGHLVCSFLALVLRKELDERLAAAGFDSEWADIVCDLDRLEEVSVDQKAKRFVLRTDALGCAAGVFKAVAVALPRPSCGTCQPPPLRPSPRHPRQATVDGRGVVPRAPEFPELALQIKRFEIRDVELQFNGPRSGIRAAGARRAWAALVDYRARLHDGGLCPRGTGGLIVLAFGGTDSGGELVPSHRGDDRGAAKGGSSV